ncbi:MAG: transglutaminase-like domain-containing protein [Pirellulales bacterium]
MHRCIAVSRFVGVACMIGLAATSGRCEELSTSVATALERAGDNRPELERAVREVPVSHRAGMEFLVAYMPLRDLTSLPAEFLLENVEYAYRAYDESPWKDGVPQDVFLNDVLPYANITERRDNWRKSFYEKFKPLVAGIKTPGEAAVVLNQQLFPLLKVKYSTKRRRADQGPEETIESGIATCSGLSILLIDACRAVGVPARFVGIPMWPDGSGNHSWVEVWDQGWHFTGAAEPAGDELDRAWFNERASGALRDEIEHAIFAVSYRKTPQVLPLRWGDDSNVIYTVNVTDRYAGKAPELSDGQVRVMFRVLDGAENTERVAAEIEVHDAQGTLLFSGTTKDERFDLNDHLVAVLPRDAELHVHVCHDKAVLDARVTPRDEGQLVSLELADGASAQ